MKFLLTALLAASASASGLKARQMQRGPVVSEYELSLLSESEEGPSKHLPITIKDDKLGFYGLPPSGTPLSIKVYEDYDDQGHRTQVVRQVPDLGSGEMRIAIVGDYITLAGDAGDGLRDLVSTEVELQSGGVFEFDLIEAEGEEYANLFDVKWGALTEGEGEGEGEGQGDAEAGEVEFGGREPGWILANVGDDDYELQWYDGKSFTTMNVFPTRLVGRLRSQT